MSLKVAPRFQRLASCRFTYRRCAPSMGLPSLSGKAKSRSSSSSVNGLKWTAPSCRVRWYFWVTKAVAWERSSGARCTRSPPGSGSAGSRQPDHQDQGEEDRSGGVEKIIGRQHEGLDIHD